MSENWLTLPKACVIFKSVPIVYEDISVDALHSGHFLNRIFRDDSVFKNNVLLRCICLKLRNLFVHFTENPKKHMSFKNTVQMSQNYFDCECELGLLKEGTWINFHPFPPNSLQMEEELTSMLTLLSDYTEFQYLMYVIVSVKNQLSECCINSV